MEQVTKNYRKNAITCYNNLQVTLSYRDKQQAFFRFIASYRNKLKNTTSSGPAKWISKWRRKGAWNTKKYCQPPWLTEKKKFRILDALEWLKQ